MSADARDPKGVPRNSPMSTNKQCQYVFSKTDVSCAYPLVTQPSSQEYCIFHLPKSTDEEHKKTRAEQSEALQKERDHFANEFFKLIHKDSATNEYDFSGFQFPSISFDGLQFDKGVVFYEAIFVGRVTFNCCIFRRGVDFTNAKFKDRVEFLNIWVQDTQFASLAPNTSQSDSTTDVSVQPNALFYSTEFRSTVIFKDVRFAGIAIFKGAVFNSEAHFIQVKFYGETPSVTIDGAVSFAGTTFKEDVIFDNCYFRRLANFQQTSFIKSATFRADEKPGCFNAEANFTNLPLNETTVITFDRVNLEKASFLDTNVEAIVFRDVKWFQFPSEHFLGSRRSAALYDEYLVDNDKYDPDKRDYWYNQRLERYERIAEVYRQLVLNYKKKRNFILADEFHLGDLELRRKKTRSPLNMYALYRLSSNYGTNYWRALSVLLVIACLSSTVFLFSGLRPGKDSGDDTGQIINYDLSLQPEKWVSVKQFASDYGKAFLLSLSIIRNERFYEPLGWETRVCLFVAVLLLAVQFGLVVKAIKRRLTPVE